MTTQPALLALELYAAESGKPTPAEAIRSLITDLGHLCAAAKIDFMKEMLLGYNAYTEEVKIATGVSFCEEDS